MEPLHQEEEDGASVNTGMESWHQLPVEEDPSQFLGQTSALHETSGQHGVALNPDEHISIFGDSRMHRVAHRSESFQLEFQDSHLSPALTLIPQTKTLVLSDSTLLHQTDSEFVPLRGFPDMSIASERYHHLSHLDVESNFPNTLHEQASLSQHPLGVTAAISEGGSSCCSLSQHSLSPGSHFHATQIGEEEEEEQESRLKNNNKRQMEGEEQTNADLDTGEATACAVSGGAPICLLVGPLEKDVHVASSYASAVSSASVTALNQTSAVLTQPHSTQNQSKHTELGHYQAPDYTSEDGPKPRPFGSREQPQGGSSSSLSQRQTTGKNVVSLSSNISMTSNITVRSSSMQPDCNTDPSHRLLLSFSQSSVTVSEKKNQSGTKNAADASCVTPASAVGVYVPGLQRVLWASGSQMAADGSFLTSQPVSQSTPAVLFSRAAPAMTKLSPIYSHQNTIDTMALSTQTSSSKVGQMPPLHLSTTDPQTTANTLHVSSSYLVDAHKETPVLPLHHEVPDAHDTPSAGLHVAAFTAEETSSHPPNLYVRSCLSEKEFKDQDSTLSAGRVRSLPTLSYLQKVDAWKVNQSSSGSFYDNLTMQGVDHVSVKKKVQNSVSDIKSPRGENETSESDTNTSAQAPRPAVVASSQSKSGSPRRGDGLRAGGVEAPPSASPLAHSHSHSSLSTVVTSIQQDRPQHNLQLPLASSDGISPYLHESLLLPGGVPEQNPTGQPDTTDPVNPSALHSLGQFSDVSSYRNIENALSSSQGSFHGEQSLLASVGAASSVVSLEVDNYAPYWTSRPGSPPPSFEFNIEDRIPLYLRNLGIDQSPSTILNPFTPRGPIREPEFSPTDLCTIKGSVGTPTKSTQLSEGGSPQKETFSSSSLLSANSSTSLPLRLAIQKPDRPASPGSVRMVHCQASEAAPDPHTSSHPYSASQESGAPQREGSYGLPAPLSPDSGALLEAKQADSSLVGSGTLQEIRRLLGQAENLVSGHSSLASSPGSHCYSESNASFLSFRRNAQSYRDDSSLSLGGKTSLVLARSSSDSALKESTSSSCGPLQLSTHSDHMISEGTTSFKGRDENLKSRDLSVAPRRTEPEGCSAADPDKVGPVSLPVMQGNVPSATDDHQQSQESAENTGVSSPENSQIHSPAEAELGVLSDSSSESSLAARVAKLLQSESPVSVVTSRPSTTDPEESRAREWIMMKVSGRQCESLELNVEDRKRIEEIKRELLLHTIQPKWSSDSEGSAQSSVGAASDPTGGFAAVRNAEDRLSEQLQRATRNPLDSVAQLHTPLSQTLEARVRQIALREGLNFPAPLTSVTISSTHCTPSPHQETHFLTAQDDPTRAAPRPEQRSGLAYSLQKYTDDESSQTLASNRGTEIEEKVAMRTDNERKGEKTDLLVVEDVDRNNVTSKKDVAPSMRSPSQKSHMSHIHLTFSPKPHQGVNQTLHSPADDAHGASDLQTRISKHHSVSSSSEEQHTSAISKTSASEDGHTGCGQHTGMVSGYSQISSRYPQVFTPPQRCLESARPSSFHTAAVPTLLPYKPHGSTELFYMPQTDPEPSPVRSDTTLESSHPGSDDAVPPRFTTEVLGSRELEDSSVTPKHKEGIYSKRATMSRGLHGSKVTAGTQSDNAGSHYQLPASRTSDGSDVDQGAIRHSEQAEQDEEEFVPLHMEADYSTYDFLNESHTVQKRSLVPETLVLPVKPIREEEREKGMKTQELGLEITTSLDQLWQRFSRRWSLQEAQPTNEGEMSLLERLERLSRLLNSTTPPHTPAKQACSREERDKSRAREHELKRVKGKETSRRGKEKGKSEFGVAPKTAWVESTVQASQTLEEEEQENAHRYPAERDESASVSVETSSNQSTIDTQRLIRAFGPNRLNSGTVEVTGGHTQKTSGSLLKLYNTINKQRRGQDTGISEHRITSASTEVISADESTASGDSLSSPSSYTLPSQRGTARALSSKKRKVKVVSRGIQAGDLEIVVNGTRRHTRDVGTIFPSPCNARETRAPPQTSVNANIYTLAASRIGSARSQTVLRREGLHKSNQTCYPNGVSWFVSADELKQDARKENEPQSEAVQAVSHAWFEPYSRTLPWREPLREPLKERHIQLAREKSFEPKASLENDSRKPSALVRLSLQEALELHHPGFVSRSRERMKRLCLLAEERRMQAVFTREREELFNRPLPLQQPIAAPPPLPAKRVIPVKEMVQRSKRIYAQLPEVQKRKQEEKRKAEYHTYRLNAQLFNKKVTNHVLGRRVPWQ
ncbi:uncharacterized protein alms1 isoform X2 [Salminus brasiliensis]|uniref:uncharacterized protein alms1 isoform X2 n=1 Tax=Salminus brasiliensis TaxID=930266 RepID=UPI003B8348CF